MPSDFDAAYNTIWKVSSNRLIFQHDNDPKQTSKGIKASLDTKSHSAMPSVTVALGPEHY